MQLSSIGVRLFFLALLVACNAAGRVTPNDSDRGTKAGSLTGETIVLPSPDLKGLLSLEETLAQRRSVREFSPEPLTFDQLGQLLWAAQGVTDAAGHRTAPSAGALYPLEVYAVNGTGVYHYQPGSHSLQRVAEGDFRPALAEAALGQEAVRQAPVVFVITGVFERTSVKYGSERSPRYVHLEAGHAAQNVLLQAVALGLGAVPVGAFHDQQVMDVLGLPQNYQPLYLLPVGKPR